MHVRIRLFAGLRDRAGADHIDMELGDGACVGEALSQLRTLTGELPVVMAVNHQYASAETPLSADDELALIPPVSGGAIDTLHVRVTAEPLRLDPLLERVRDPRAGAVVTFLGVVREAPELEYQAYVEMAERRMTELVAEAIERHGLCAAAAEHRVGLVPLCEPSVAVAASAAHREEAFAGARAIIDEIKSQVPVWKKEEGQWVRGVAPAPGT